MISLDFSQLLSLSDTVAQNAQRAAQIAGLNLVATSTERVHGKGLDTAGNAITSTHRESGGDRPVVREPKYSDGYAAFRRSRGRQTRFIDLRLEGILQSSYQMQPTQSGFITGYFTGNNAQKINAAEERHGSPIINPSEQEIDGIIEDLRLELFR